MALSEQENQEWRDRFRHMMVETNFIKSLGVVVDSWGPDGVVLRAPFSEQLTNDGREYHGGVIAALLDTAGAAAVWAGHDFNKGFRASTVSMTINYVGRAQGDLLASARCVKRGRDVHFSEMQVDDPSGTLVATGLLVYRIVP